MDRSLNIRVEVAVGIDQRKHQTTASTAVVFTHDHILRNVHQTAGQVTRVSGTQRGIGKTLTSTVSCDEVLQHRQPFTVGGLNRAGHNLALRVRHQTADTRNLTNLHPVTTCARGHHAVDGIQTTVVAQILAHSLSDRIGSFGPNLDELFTALVVANHTDIKLILNRGGLLLIAFHNRGLSRRGRDIRNGDGHARTRCPVEASVLEVIQGTRHDIHRVLLSKVVNELAQSLLICNAREPRVILRQSLVEQNLTDSALQQNRIARRVTLRGFPTLGRYKLITRETHLNLGVQLNIVTIHRHQSFSDRRECVALVLLTFACGGQVVQANDHILRRHSYRTTVRRLQDVVRGEHQNACLSLSLGRERQVNRHLVAVEVSVERRTHERMQLNSLTLNQLRLERLNTQTVQGRCTVQQHRMLGNDLFENIPHLRAETLNHTLSTLNVLRVRKLHQALHDEGLEQLQRHLLRQTALMHFQLRTNHDHGTAGVVHALTEQVLAETTLLTLEHIGERLQRAVTGTGHGATTTTVIEERIHSFLQHTLFVIHNDLGSAKLQQALEAVVTVDHTTVQVVQVGSRKATAIELNHRAQLRRNNRNNIQHHTQRGVISGQEGVYNLQTLERAGLLLTLTGLNDLFQGLSFGL